MKFGSPKADAERVLTCLRNLRLPLSHPALSRTRELFAGLEEFRQHLGGRLTVTMLEAVGQPIDVHEIDHELMKVAIDRVRCFAGDSLRPVNSAEAKSEL